jgi:fumarate reductase subunit C
LRAFASGSTAMTGIEAISNAVPAFKPVEWRNARRTLTWMIGLLISMFVGIVVVVHLDGVVPEPSQTVLSQLAHLDFGSGPLYVYTQAATALVLLLAADTAYNDFPRVMFLLARDRFAPRPFLKMGDRLAFNNGIVFLSIVAALVFIAFSGNLGQPRAARAHPVALPRRHPADGRLHRIAPRAATRPHLDVIVPDLALRHRWQRLLHEDRAVRLRHALAPLSKVVVTSVPFHV